MKKILLILIILLSSCVKVQNDYKFEDDINIYHFVAQETDDDIRYYRILKREDGLIFISTEPFVKPKNNVTEAQ